MHIKYLQYNLVELWSRVKSTFSPMIPPPAPDLTRNASAISFFYTPALHYITVCAFVCTDKVLYEYFT